MAPSEDEPGARDDCPVGDLAGEQRRGIVARIVLVFAAEGQRVLVAQGQQDARRETLGPEGFASLLIERAIRRRSEPEGSVPTTLYGVCLVAEGREQISLVYGSSDDYVLAWD